MAAGFKLNGSRGLAFDWNLLADDAKWLPLALPFHLIGVGWVDLLNKDIVHICASECETPGNVLVVTAMYPDERGFGGTNNVPARGIEVHVIAQGRISDRAMRIVSNEGLAGLRELAHDCPVVAASFEVAFMSGTQSRRGRGR